MKKLLLILLFPVLMWGQFNPVAFYEYGNSQIRKKIVSHYTLDNTLADKEGMSPVGIEIGGASYSTGIISTSALFNGANQYMRFPDSDNFSFTNGVSDLPFTISFWVYFTGFSSNSNRLITKRDVVTNTISEYQIQANSTSITFFKGSGGGLANNVSTSSSFSFSLNVWYHIVVSSNTVSEKIYINGNNMTVSIVNTGTYVAMNNTTAELVLGKLTTLANSEHQGRIDDFMIWKDRELKQVDVTKIYNLGLLGRSIN